jgi:hypothetical protein
VDKDLWSPFRVDICGPFHADLIRRRRETNTFHLTLEDVTLLLGMAIDGEPVIGPISAPSAACEKLLGRVPEDLNGGTLKMHRWRKLSAALVLTFYT